MSVVQEQAQQTDQAEQPKPPASDAGQESQALARSEPSVAASIGFGTSAENWQQGLKIAGVLSKSLLVPKQFQGRPEDIVVAMQHGAEVGLPPMASLQSIGVINGKPGLYGDGFLGVIMSKPAYAKHTEYYELADGTHVKSLRRDDYENDDTKAVSMFWRKGNPEPFVGEFSIGDAKRAKLWGKEGPWQTNPARMLKMRARGFAGRDGFSAELRGLKTLEELHDTPDDDIEVTSGPVPVAEPIRRSERSAGSGTTAAAAADDPVLTNELPEAPAADQGAAANPNGGRQATSTRRAAPAAAPASAKKTQFTNLSPAVTTPNMLITGTSLVTPKGVDPFYEVRAVRKEAGKDDTSFLLLTDDEALYKQAATCEGSDTPFRITWAGGKKYDKSTCKVLLAIEAAN